MEVKCRPESETIFEMLNKGQRGKEEFLRVLKKNILHVIK